MDAPARINYPAAAAPPAPPPKKGALFYLVGIPSAAVYITWQVALQVFQEVKKAGVGLVWEHVRMGESGLNEGFKFARAISPGWHESVTLTRELVFPVFQELGCQLRSGGYQTAIGTVWCAKTAVEYGERPAKLIGNVVYENGRCGWAGLCEAGRFAYDLPENIWDGTTLPREVLWGVTKELVGHSISGAYQLYIFQNVVRTTVQELMEIGTVRAIYAEQKSLIQAGRNEYAKLKKELKMAAVEFKENFQEACQDIFGEIFSQGEAFCIQTVVGGEYLWDISDYPRELFLGFGLEALLYLKTGTVQAGVFLKALERFVKERTEIQLEILTGTAEELYAYLHSGLGELKKTVIIPKTILEMMELPKELLIGVLLELSRYLVCAVRETGKFSHFFTEDVAGSFGMLVVDPFVIWWHPKQEILMAWIAEVQRNVHEIVRDVTARWRRQ